MIISYLKYSYQPENAKVKISWHRHFKHNTIAVFVYRYSFQHEIFLSLFEIQLSTRKCKITTSRDIDTLNIMLLLCLYIDTPFGMKYSQVYFKYSYQPENAKNKISWHMHFKHNTIAVFVYRYSFQHEIFSSLFEIQLSTRKCKKSKFRDVGTLIIILLLCSWYIDIPFSM